MSDRDEAALRDTFASLSSGATNRDGCPVPDQLWAAARGELRSDETTTVVDHIVECAACAEDWRLAADINRDAGLLPQPVIPVEPAAWRWFEWPQMRGAFAAAAVVVVAGTAVYRMTRTTAPPLDAPSPTAPASAAPAAPSPPVPVSDPFPFEKPAVELTPSRAIPFRGTADDGFMTAFGPAIALYREDRFDEAAKRLADVSRQYPKDPEPHFYRGVSLLFLDRNAEAVDALEAARRAADPQLANTVRWYLAAAYHRTGRDVDTFKELEAVCGGGSPYSERACEVRDRLTAARGR